MVLYLAIFRCPVARARLALRATALCHAVGIEAGHFEYPADDDYAGLYVVSGGVVAGWLSLLDLVPDYPGA